MSTYDVFPHPIELDPVSSSPPTWAIAIIVAAAGVTLLWAIAIFILILVEIYRRARLHSSNAPSSNVQHFVKPNLAASQDASAREDVVLGTPPPPIPPPAVHQPTSTLHDVNSPDGKPEFKLSLDKSGDDDVSLSSSYASFCSSDSEDQEEKGKPVVSESVRCDSASASGAVCGATDVTSAADGEDTPLAGMVLSRPVTVRQLGATIREPNYIETEFRKLPHLTISTEELPPGTERKNRYTNVLPTPKTRVELTQIFGHSNSNYINANYLRGFKGIPRQYIATQGPLETTIEDFWRMILENNASIIIMATNFQERGIEKCTRYWPAQGSEEYGSIQVTLLQQTAHGTYNTSVLQVQASGGEPRTVTHYRLTFWPHQGVPKSTKTATDFLRSVKMADHTGPAVVHCSSGIGRTAVLVACDIGMQGLLQGEPRVDVLRIVSTLRQDRAGMVQTREQYRFIHEALYNIAKEECSK